METIAIVGRTPAILLRAERYALLDDVVVQAVVPHDRTDEGEVPPQHSRDLSDALEESAPRASEYESLANALAESGDTIDCIDIAAPASVADGALDTALDSAVPTLCPPPLVTDPDRVDDVRLRVTESESWLMNGNPHRFSRFYERLQKQIKAGAIGALGVARIERIVPHCGQGWNAWYVEGGDLIDGVMAYDFDLLTEMFGPIKRGFSRIGNVESVVHAHVLLRFQSGATGQVEVTSDQAGSAPRARIEFSGNYGRVRLFDKDASSVHYQKKDRRDPSVPTDDCYARMVRTFVECVRNGDPPRSGVSDALETTKAVHAAECSADAERPMRLGEVGP